MRKAANPIERIEQAFDVQWIKEWIARESASAISGVPSGEMDSKPDGGLIFQCPRYAMGTMSRDQNVIARTKLRSPSPSIHRPAAPETSSTHSSYS
jgi:hypothetical protein